MNEEPRMPDEEFDDCASISLRVAFTMDCNKVNPKQRAAARKIVSQLVAEVHAKLLLTGLSKMVVMRGTEHSSMHGARPMLLPEEVSDE